jgi:hypothetical protein
MAIASIAAVLLVSMSDISDPWLTFGMSPGHPKERVLIEVGTVLQPSKNFSENEELIYWAKMTAQFSDLKGTWWTDSRRCPQMKKVLASVADLRLPTIWTPESQSEVFVHSDAAKYELTATTTYGGRFGSEMHIEAQPETPLAAWFDESYRTLHACWTSQRP